MRLAWFTPLPPQRSGISAYSAEVLPRLAGHHEIDVVIAPGTTAEPPDPAIDIVDLWEFQRRHLRQRYDAVVYQLGNAPCHDYMWPALVHYPGLVVLHDGQLHHARARTLLKRGRRDDYRAEFAANHPDAPPRLTEFVVNGLQGSPYYLWPMRRLVIEQSLLTAVHSAPLADVLRGEHPGCAIAHIPMGVAPAATRAPVDVPLAASGRPRPSVVFGAFGLITHEKRIPQLLKTFAAVQPSIPDSHLVLVGDVAPHYDVAADIAALGIGRHVTVTGYVDDASSSTWLASIDVAVCLRWPTGGETSASLLRCLAAGRATITTDLVHTGDVPSLDPRTWLVQHTRTDAGAMTHAPTWRDAVTVAIDVLDEEHSLALAMVRLARDRELRGVLSANASAHWRAHHTLEAMQAGYDAALARLHDMRPRPRRPRPAHLDANGLQGVRAVQRAFGVDVGF